MSENNSNYGVYVQYNNRREIKNLDLNVWNSSNENIESGATGRHLYDVDPRHSAYYVCFPGRDTETHYILGQDRETHPDHSSRFGYGRCPNGYCLGNWSSGKYVQPDGCCTETPPPNCAPERFYNEFHQSPYNTISQATVNYNNAMNTI